MFCVHLLYDVHIAFTSIVNMNSDTKGNDAMKKLMITTLLSLFASCVSASGEIITERDLMKNYIAELESEYIGQTVDLYDGDAVLKAVKKHQQYLMLCNHKFASNKCEQAAQELSELDNALTAHFKFQKDLSEMWDIKESLDTSSPNDNAEEWRELKSNYLLSLSCGLASGEVDQQCLARFSNKGKGMNRGAELVADYLKEQACTLPSGEVDQDCMSK